MKQLNPRIPNNEREVFAMAWTIGYVGISPWLKAVFPHESFDNCPEFIDPLLAHEWKRGYDSGVAFFCDHAINDDEEVSA